MSSTIWMGDLDPYQSEQDIVSIWQLFSFQPRSVKLIRHRYTGSNCGYCFVEFDSVEEASMALQLHGTVIPNENKILKLNWASRSAQNAPSSNSSLSLLNNGMSNLHLNSAANASAAEFSLFVGDLSPEVTDTILTQTFLSKYPSTKTANVLTDPASGASRGYGFVRFLDENESQRAILEMNGYFLNGRPIRVSTATPKTSSNQQKQIQQQVSTQQQAQQQFQPDSNLNSQQLPFSMSDPTNTTVFIGGLSPQVMEPQLRATFQPFGDIIYVKIPAGKGCGFVQYTTREAAERAIAEMQGYNMGGGRIRLSWGRSSNRNYYSNQQQFLQQQQLQQFGGMAMGLGTDSFNMNNPNNIYSLGATHGGITGLPNHNGINIPPFTLSNNQSNNNININNDSMIQLPGTPGRLKELYIAASEGRLDRVNLETSSTTSASIGGASSVSPLPTSTNSSSTGPLDIQNLPMTTINNNTSPITTTTVNSTRLMGHLPITNTTVNNNNPPITTTVNSTRLMGHLSTPSNSVVNTPNFDIHPPHVQLGLSNATNGGLQNIPLGLEINPSLKENNNNNNSININNTPVSYNINEPPVTSLSRNF